MAIATTVLVPDAVALRQTIDSYIVQGFSVAIQDADSATMMKKKEFNVVWAVIGFFLCLIPLLIYCIVYATQHDQMVRIVIGSAAVLGAGAGAIKVSPDGNWWWSEALQKWVGVLEQLPPGVRVSDDGYYWWDGGQWRQKPVPTDRDGDGTVTTRDASASPFGVPTAANSDTVQPAAGDELPPPPSG
jgi:hypothetical protein